MSRVVLLTPLLVAVGGAARRATAASAPTRPGRSPRASRTTAAASGVDRRGASAGARRAAKWVEALPSTINRSAPVAQLDRASVYGTEGQRFESSRARLF